MLEVVHTTTGLFWREVKAGAEKIGCSQRSKCQTKNVGVYLTDSV